MRLNQLEDFVVTCRQGSIAKAAIQLGRSRSAVSMSISALEDRLGVILFERTGNRTHLTQMAQDILDDCERILELANHIDLKCSHHLQGVESSLRIVRDDALPEYFWRNTIIEMKRLYPELNLVFALAASAELQEYVTTGAVDLAFGIRTANEPVANLEISVLSQIRSLMVTSREHPLTRLTQVRQDDLDRYPHISEAFFDEEGLRSLSVPSARQIGISSFELMRDMVLEGMGWAHLPAPLVNPLLRKEELRVLRHRRSIEWSDYIIMQSPTHKQGEISEWLLSRVKGYLQDLL
ncbi:LysR family transcriptional regulator [Dongshaea marina]|uniref:LysR family transcriptional regulator n=1 Tax=Dongshaea marina TaxID=2047966 RepID=UPI00131F1075|nr:LysR family transcriptional regulator [Dongshaea marina]